MIKRGVEQLLAERAAAATPYLEFLRSGALSAGLYVLPAGAVDGQSPHDEDEIYVVMAGRSKFTSGGQEIDVTRGDTIFVPAHEAHRFHDIAEDLQVVVVFAPPEGNAFSG